MVLPIFTVSRFVTEEVVLAGSGVDRVERFAHVVRAEKQSAGAGGDRPTGRCIAQIASRGDVHALDAASRRVIIHVVLWRRGMMTGDSDDMNAHVRGVRLAHDGVD